LRTELAFTQGEALHGFPDMFPIYKLTDSLPNLFEESVEKVMKNVILVELIQVSPILVAI
jgi:hypothetical protein